MVGLLLLVVVVVVAYVIDMCCESPLQPSVAIAGKVLRQHRFVQRQIMKAWDHGLLAYPPLVFHSTGD